MLRHQMFHQQARELALHYISSQGATLSPADWLSMLQRTEAQFLALLKARADET